MTDSDPDRRRRSAALRRRGLPVYAVTPFTMLDFPGRTACIAWFAGCNLRCRYCHNPAIVLGRGRGSTDDVLKFLRRRRGLLDGVVLSGGEATTYPELPAFVREVRALGFAVKLDTNGLRPDAVAALLAARALDYVALDYKAPPGKLKAISGTGRFDLFGRTLQLLCAQTAVPFEVRTTVHTDLLDEADIAAIIHDLESRHFRGSYYVQNVRIDDDRQTLGRLRPQARRLDLAALPVPSGFDLGVRNF